MLSQVAGSSSSSASPRSSGPSRLQPVSGTYRPTTSYSKPQSRPFDPSEIVVVNTYRNRPTGSVGPPVQRNLTTPTQRDALPPSEIIVVNTRPKIAPRRTPFDAPVAGSSTSIPKSAPSSRIPSNPRPTQRPVILNNTGRTVPVPKEGPTLIPIERGSTVVKPEDSVSSQMSVYQSLIKDLSGKYP
ncbi:hypothetical protein HDU99_007869 [Rhizoclosmatium hyalinum]|nr:hypothetical protein HDU99_007869 [Rhizoclosmatium hyalinum]